MKFGLYQNIMTEHWGFGPDRETIHNLKGLLLVLLSTQYSKSGAGYTKVSM